MLIYLATYPRSGCSVLKTTIFTVWRHIAANGYEPETVWRSKHRMRELADPDLLSYVAHGERRRVIRSPALPRLTPELRAKAAADHHLYFVKTHELPPGGPLAGEVALQLVRHPAAAIHSWWSLHQRTKKDPPPLQHFISGADHPGEWGAYHEVWLATSMPVWRMRFEDAIKSPHDLVDGVSGFLGLDYVRPPHVLSQERVRSANPVRNPCLGSDAWRDSMTVADLVRIDARTKATARKFGYFAFGIAEPYVRQPPLRQVKAA